MPDMTRGHLVEPGLELLPGGAALLRDENVMVVADLHLGCEASLEHEGFSIPRVQTRKISEYLVGVVQAHGPDRLVIAGDLKHDFSRNLRQEWDEVAAFIGMLTDLVDIEVVKGNHDNYLASILSEHGLALSKLVEIGGYTITHGHAGIGRTDAVIIGHVHPSLTLSDEVGARVKHQCFLYDSERRFLVLPALSIISPGVDVVRNTCSDRMSPVLPEPGLGGFRPIAFSGPRPLAFPRVRELREAD